MNNQLLWLSPIFLPLGGELTQGAADSPPGGLQGGGAGEVTLV